MRVGTLDLHSSLKNQLADAYGYLLLYLKNICKKLTGIIVSHGLDWKNSCLWFPKDYLVIQEHKSLFNALFNQMTVPRACNSNCPGGEIIVSHLL